MVKLIPEYQFNSNTFQVGGYLNVSNVYKLCFE